MAGSPTAMLPPPIQRAVQRGESVAGALHQLCQVCRAPGGVSAEWFLAGLLSSLSTLCRLCPLQVFTAQRFDDAQADIALEPVSGAPAHACHIAWLAVTYIADT
jgi:hypothetical protein